MQKGLYRVPGGTGQQNYVQVDDGGIENSILESLYVARKIQPPLAKLKWRDAYFEDQRKEAAKAFEAIQTTVPKPPGGSDA